MIVSATFKYRVGLGPNPTRGKRTVTNFFRIDHRNEHWLDDAIEDLERQCLEMVANEYKVSLNIVSVEKETIEV